MDVYSWSRAKTRQPAANRGIVSLPPPAPKSTAKPGCENRRWAKTDVNLGGLSFSRS